MFRITRIAALFLLGALLIVAVACNGDGNDDESETATPEEQTPLATAVSDDTPADTVGLDTASPDEGAALSPEDEAALTQTTQAGLDAIQSGDQAGIRAVMSEALNEAVPDDEIAELVDCMATAVFAIPPIGEISGTGDAATVDVVFIGPEAVEVARMWPYEQQEDGAWLLVAPPPCPPTF
jgi:hypothetical protein